MQRRLGQLSRIRETAEAALGSDGGGAAFWPLPRARAPPRLRRGAPDGAFALMLDGETGKTG